MHVSPNDTIAILDLGKYRMESGAVGEAVELLRRGLALPPGDAMQVREYGMALRDGLMRLGRREESREIWGRLIESDQPEA